MIKNTCPCGVEFTTTPKRIAAGRGRYCSRACLYRYRVRPSGLTYEIKSDNSAWFSAGHVPHNAGTATPKPGPGHARGPRHHLWKGDEAGYHALHSWVRRWAGVPVECELCGATETLEWSNRTGEYRRELNDWWALCAKCHRNYDRRNLAGAIARRFQ